MSHVVFLYRNQRNMRYKKCVVVILKKFRLFVAVNFSDKTKNTIEALIKELKIIPADAKWVSRKNLHITLKFLGDTPDEQIPAVITTLEQAAVGLAPLELKLGGFGVFPGQNRPRVFWLGSAGETAMLAKLQAQVESGLEQLGFKQERGRFTPHLTLARLRSPVNINEVLEKADRLYAKDSIVAKETISSFELMSSVLSPKGPSYSVMASFRL